MFYFLIISAAVNAFIYNSVLITEGHILYGWHKWLTNLFSHTEKIEVPGNIPPEVKQLMDQQGVKEPQLYRFIEKRHWILKPLGDCPLCMAGQFVLWGIVAIYFLPPDIFHITRTAWHVITMICASILLVKILQKLSDGSKS